jgi:hypothetical protein
VHKSVHAYDVQKTVTRIWRAKGPKHAYDVQKVRSTHMTYKSPYYVYHHHHHDHQPINVTAGAKAFLMDYTQRERAITHHAGPVRAYGELTIANAAETNGLTYLPKHGGA